MAPDILSVLGVAAKEDAITNLLAYCIDVEPLFRDTFLRTICNIEPGDNCRVKIETRPRTGTSGLPDLILAVEASEKRYLVVLENKLEADEGKDQTKRYASPECIRSIKKRIEWCEATAEERFIFLTLFPDQEPEENKFIHKTYNDLLEAINSPLTLTDSLALILLEAWRSLLRQFYSNSVLAHDLPLLQALQPQDRDPLDGSYLRFSGFVRRLSIVQGLEVKPFKSGGLGRQYFGAVINKAHWHPEVMQKINGQYHQLDPLRHFNIHFEPQLHCLEQIDKSFRLYLHYELNPYLTRSEIKSIPLQSQYNEFLKVRSDFYDRLQSIGIQDLKMSYNKNMIASKIGRAHV